MKILISPFGSYGDLHPMVGLALKLRERGHEVTLIANGYAADLFAKLGLDWVELGDAEQFRELGRHPDLWHPTRAFGFIIRNAVEPLMERHYEIIAERFQPGETLLVNSVLGMGARIAQEKLGAPSVTVHLQPSVIWSNQNPPLLPGMLLGERTPFWLRRLTYYLGVKYIIDPMVCKPVNKLRSELGLSPPMKQTPHWWHSPECVIGMFPAWFAPHEPDWPANVHLTDFPLWDETGVSDLDTDLDAFLRAGPPPIAFTPGSAMIQGEAFFEAAVQACHRLRRRGLLLSRFPEQIPKNLPADVRHVEYAPFSQLLPRVAAIVHHGGIGTTAQALAAGVPQLIMPMSHDQPDNALRIRNFGVGDWLKPRQFRPSAVAEKLRRLLESASVRAACQTYAAKLAGADGLGKSADVIEQFAAQRGLQAGRRGDKVTG